MRLTTEQKKDSLTNFLRMVSKNEELFIHSINKGSNIKFAVAIKSDSAVDHKSNFMTYEEMNCYFFGVIAVQEKRVNF